MLGVVREIRFECVPGCTACCERPGFVYLTEQDVERAARFLGLTPQEFERRYVYRTRYRLRLRKPRGWGCYFLTSRGCSIHPVKPVQCRLFPFWPELVEERQAWEELSSWCPGVGRGPRYSLGRALEIAHQMRLAYPAMYAEAGSRSPQIAPGTCAKGALVGRKR